MKKLNVVILALFILLSFIACTNDNGQEKTTTKNTQSTFVDETVYSNLDPQSNQDVSNETRLSDIGGGEITLQKYRSIYYSIPSPFWDIVDENSRNNIYGEYWELPYSETNVMRMKIFVEEYNVPREKFDAANAEWARIVKEKLYGTPVINPQDFANQEFNEVYNADIIYTFDDEIINEYYLSHDYPYCYESEYEYALENESYTTKTPIIIDITDLEEELAFFSRLKTEKSAISTETVTEAENIQSTETSADIPYETETTA